MSDEMLHISCIEPLLNLKPEDMYKLNEKWKKTKRQQAAQVCVVKSMADIQKT